MSYILGLDLGVNSIGWAIFDEQNHIYKSSGIRIYQDIDPTGKEAQTSPNEERRLYRSRRRQLIRKRFRKELLYKKLCDYGIISRKEFPEYASFVNFVKELNPYLLRYEGLKRQLTLPEFARVLFHFAQRRGFLSNRKQFASVKDDERSKVKQEIKSLEERISNKTLGQFFFELYPTPYLPYEYKERIRQRFTSRRMFYDELQQIWDKQSEYYPSILTDELKVKICDFEKGLILYQRPLKSQKNLIGKCIFEKNKFRCAKSRYEYQEFTFYQVLNNITITSQYEDPRPLTDEEKNKIFTLAINKKTTKKSGEGSLTIKEIMNKLKLTNYSFNYDIEFSLPPITFIGFVHKLFPQSYINKYFAGNFYEKIEDLWELINFAKDDNWLIAAMKTSKHFPEDPELSFYYDEEKIKLIENYHHIDGYGSLSLKAIKNILPFLKSGYKYHIATILGGLKNAFGNDYNKLSDKDRKNIEDEVLRIYSDSNSNVYKPDAVREYLKKTYYLTDEQLRKMYVHSDINSDFEIVDQLPRFELNIRNPKVTRALNETRKIVNGLLNKGYKFDKIVVEIATELKKSGKDLIDLKIFQDKNRKANQSAYKYLIEKLKIENPTREMVEKYRLYQELITKSEKDTSNNFVAMCPYTGKVITEDNLFVDGLFDVDHIIPFSRCFNDSLANKIICDAQFNRHVKGNRTPYEVFEEIKTEDWKFIKERARKILPKDKYLRFISEKVPEEDEFTTNKLNDTRYIAKAAVDYLKQIGSQVQVVSGSVTGVTRRLWGLNSILNELNRDIIIDKDGNYDPEIKNRADHRHHAIDAMVLCLITPKIIKDISTLKTRKKYDSGTKTLPYPWKSMKNDIQQIIENMVVSIKQKSNIATISSKYIIVKGKKIKIKTFSPRGKLHNETFYGYRINPETKKKVFVNRVPIQNIDTLKKVDKIMDKSIRELIKEYIINNNLADKDGKIAKGAFFTTSTDGKINYAIHLHNKRGQNIPIKKVRLFEESHNKKPILNSHNKWVEPGNNHHAEIYQDSKGNYYQVLVSFWDAVDRVKNKLPVYGDLNNKDKLVTFLKQNDIFALGIPQDINFEEIKNINKYLYRVQKITFSRKLELPDYTFRHILAARINFPKQETRVTSFSKFMSLNPYKVFINNLGEIINVIKINF